MPGSVCVLARQNINPRMQLHSGAFAIVERVLSASSIEMKLLHDTANAWGDAASRAGPMRTFVSSPRELICALPDMDLEIGPDFRQSCGLDLPVFVINLAHRTDRWAATKHRMNAAGLHNLIKAPAIDGALLEDATIRRFLGTQLSSDAPRSHLCLTRPAIGCFLSHLTIWRSLLSMNVPRALILEDDACPTSDFDKVSFRSFVEHLTSAHQLVFPGCLVMDGLAETPITAQQLARLFYFNGTFSYLVTPEACRFLLDKIFPLATHIDHQMSRLFFEYRSEFTAFHAVPHFFAPDWSLRSDCYVPLANADAADRELGAVLQARRKQLTLEGCRLQGLGLN